MADDLTRLRRFVVEHYDLEDLRTLCFDLGIRYDDLGGEGTAAKARELILRMARRRRLDELLAALRKNLPELFEQAGFSTDAAALEAIYAGLGGAIPLDAERDKRSDLKRIGALVLAAASLIIAAIVVRVLFFGKSAPASSMTAVLTNVKPEVKVARAGTDRLIPASFGMQLHHDDVVSTYEDAAATIICERGARFELPAQNNLTLDCQNTSDPHFVGQLDSALGELSVSGGLTPTLAAGQSRASRTDYAQTPLLFSPRNSIVTDTRPTFYWQTVAGASGYRLWLSLPGGETWGHDTTAPHLAYPADAPPLEPGGVNVVTLVALDDDAQQMGTADKSRLWVLEGSDRANLAEIEAKIQGQELDEGTRTYLLAQLYREQKMWSAAVAQLERLVEQGVTSTNLWRQLGDLSFEIELYSQAEAYYQDALSAAETDADPSAQAAAHAGLARVAHAFEETDQALAHLQTAEVLYRQAGETEQAELMAAERVKVEE
jgi:hypothetical protein